MPHHNYGGTSLLRLRFVDTDVPESGEELHREVIPLGSIPNMKANTVLYSQLLKEIYGAEPQLVD